MTKSCESAKCGHVAEDLLVLSVGICAGASLWYLYAPRSGRVRRRWLVRQVEHLFRRDESGLVDQVRNLFNRVAGFATDEVCAEQPDSAVTYETLAENHLITSEIRKLPGVKGPLDVPVRSKLAVASAIVFGLTAGLAAFGRSLHSPSHPGEPEGAV